MDTHLLWGALAIITSLLVQLPLIGGIRAGRCNPHAFSYAIWSVLTGVGFAAAIVGGGGAGAWAFGVTTLVCVIITGWALARGDRSYTRWDWWCLAAAALGLICWPLAGALTALSVVLIVDLVGYGPTIAKAWKQPWSEPVVLWAGNSLKHIFGVAALSQISALTLAYPLVLIIANAGLAGMLLMRRGQLAAEQARS